MRFFILLAVLLLCSCSANSTDDSVGDTKADVPTGNVVESDNVADSSEEKKVKTIRFATFNASLHRKSANRLTEDLASLKDSKATKIAAIIQTVRPDVLLVNEFDFQDGAAELFLKYLSTAQHGCLPIEYDFHFCRPVNTGTPSGIDLDGNGKTGQPNDSFGYGLFPGQYGMLVLSKFPIDESNARTFQKFLWKDMPDALLPKKEDGTNFYSDESLKIFRLSSKSHWDVPIQIGESTVHFLASHPTPPVFDGPEDRNGKRNHDEIRMWVDYVDPARGEYLYDDAGKRGGLLEGATFVIVGDQNADPVDGDSTQNAANQLVDHPLVNRSPIPSSKGAVEASSEQGRKNKTQTGDPKFDTGDFNDRGSGNLRIDYVLTSKTLQPVDAGVFWPMSGEPGHEWINASDHRLVWVDVVSP